MSSNYHTVFSFKRKIKGYEFQTSFNWIDLYLDELIKFSIRHETFQGFKLNHEYLPEPRREGQIISDLTTERIYDKILKYKLCTKNEAVV